MPARVSLPRRQRKTDRLRSQDLQGGLQVFGGDVGDGEDGHRSNQKLRQLMFALHGQDGIMSGAGEIMGEGRVIPGSGKRDFGRCLRGRVDGSGDRGGLIGTEVFHDAKGDFENARLDNLDLDVRSQCWGLPALRGNLLIHLLHGCAQLSADSGPLDRLEVVVLQEDHERCGADDGSVLPKELGPAVFGVAVRGRLRGRVVGDGSGGVCHLLD